MISTAVDATHHTKDTIPHTPYLVIGVSSEFISYNDI